MFKKSVTVSQNCKSWWTSDQFLDRGHEHYQKIFLDHQNFYYLKFKIRLSVEYPRQITTKLIQIRIFIS